MSITGIGVTAGSAVAKSTIIVTTKAGSTVTCSKSGVTKTATEKNGQWWFNNIDNGTWTVSAVNGGITKTQSVEVTKFDVYYVEVDFPKIYGISRDISTASSAWARTDDAIGMTATASVGTVEGHSDFDLCYPWSGIERETLSTKDVMVKIPKFYFRRYRESNIEHIEIADEQLSGFKLHPAFNHSGQESSYIYVGAYVTSQQNKSLSNQAPTDNASRSTMRSNAKLKGTNWGLIDISTLSAIQMLILVEFANNNVQSVIGRGYCDNTDQTLLSTGSTDNVANLTGRGAGTDGLTNVVWRGIEGLWGNVNQWIDGVNANGTTYYVCNNPSLYTDDSSSGYSSLSFMGSSWLNTYITEEGLDSTENEHVFLPSAANGGSDSTYYCDTTLIVSGSWGGLLHGGNYTAGSSDGLFKTWFLTATTPQQGTGSRLLYIPS